MSRNTFFASLLLLTITGCADDATPGMGGDSTSGDGSTSANPTTSTTSTAGETTVASIGSTSSDAGSETSAESETEAGTDGGSSSSGGTEAVCGNGVVEDDEECDDEGASKSCDADCTAATCGDVTVNRAAGEECDDGNDEPLDGCSNECTTSPVAFEYTGEFQTLVVPEGVTSAFVELHGASGGTTVSAKSGCGNSTPDVGGLGGEATGVLAVTPGETLTIRVGGAGTTTEGGFNGGGAPCLDANTCSGGGGASDIRVGDATLDDRVVVAGGGGGAEFSCDGLGGGDGGGLHGSPGEKATPSDANAGGGTESAGGAGGIHPMFDFFGSPGVLGQGGDAFQGDDSPYPGGTHSAGGGGGYYGGGGGSIDGNAGGGSSYIDGLTDAQTTPGVRLGDGVVTITWQP